MPLYAFEDKRPRIHPSSYVHPQAVIIGDVYVEQECYIGACAVLRGDFGRIAIGAETSIQDNAVVHVNEETVARFGRGCIIAHGAVLHHPSLGDGVLVGMNSVVLHGAEIGDNCVVASLTVLKEGSVYPAGKLIAGNPGRIIKDVSRSMIQRIKRGASIYARLAERCKLGLTLIED